MQSRHDSGTYSPEKGFEAKVPLLTRVDSLGPGIMVKCQQISKYGCPNKRDIAGKDQNRPDSRLYPWHGSLQSITGSQQSFCRTKMGLRQEDWISFCTRRAWYPTSHGCGQVQAQWRHGSHGLPYFSLPLGGVPLACQISSGSPCQR